VHEEQEKEESKMTSQKFTMKIRNVPGMKDDCYFLKKYKFQYVFEK